MCRYLIAWALVALTTLPARADTTPRTHAATVYLARVSSERTWQDVLRNPIGAEYADAYLVSAALSRTFAQRRNGALLWEMEGNVAYNFGEQHHLELNVAPVVARWQRFPWDKSLATSAAFGLGLSYATDMPELEIELETDTRQLLVFWFLELTAGPRDSAWSLSLRLHHRSVAWGLMGVDDGGINAVGAGIRYKF